MEDAIREIGKTLAETIMIVGLVVFLFLGSIRTAIVPLVAMPVSLIGATIAMLAMGFSLNLLTILAIVLAAGLVVDDAIVVVENVQRHVQNGKSRLQAALIGARELLSPIIAMTITLAVVYTPIGFQGGLTGMLFREFAFTLAAAVLVSGMVAVTLSPVMSCMMIHPAGHEAWLTRVVNVVFEQVRRVYSTLLRGAIELRWSIAISTIIIALAAAPLYMFSGKELAPVEDQSGIALILEAAPDSTLAATSKWTQQMASELEKIPEYENMWGLAQSGSGFGGLVTVPFNKRDRNTSEIQPEVMQLVSKVPGINCFPFTLPPLPTSGYSAVEMVVKSDKPIEEMADSINEILERSTKAGKFMFANSDLKLDLPLARVDVDRDKVADLGMDLAMIAQELGVLLGGGYVNRFNHFNRSYEVIPQLAETDRQSLGALMDLKIRSPGGDLIPASSFASIRAGTAPRSLTRFQQQSAVKITAEVFPGVTKQDGLDTMEQIARDVLGPSASIDYAGQFYSQVGLITLVGLVAKNGILIVEFANTLQAAGHDKWHAIHEAAQTRLRPVLMTSAATVFGHFPLVLVAGPGAEARNSIGIVLVAGMAIGTFFTLFVVPALYMLIAAKHNASEIPDIDEAIDAETNNQRPEANNQTCQTD